MVRVSVCLEQWSLILLLSLPMTGDCVIKLEEDWGIALLFLRISVAKVGCSNK